MSKLICLLSDQRMQNVIPLFQKGLRYEQVFFIASGEGGKINPRYANIYTDICRALPGLTNWILWQTPVNPMNPQSTCSSCNQIIEANGGEGFTINFTGGTKPMSIGAYLAGVQAGATLLYVDTQKEQIYQYHSDETTVAPFDLKRITVRQALTLHHRIIDEKRTAANDVPAREMMLEEEVYSRRPNSFQSLLNLHTQIKRALSTPNGERGIPFHVAKMSPWFFEVLDEIGWLTKKDNMVWIHQKAVEQINGKWLERYVYAALKKDGRFMDVLANVQIAEVENEIDVACTLNGKLAIMECKSGIMDGQGTLNRLRALKDSMAGAFGKSFLVTCRNQKNLGQVFLKRAQEYVSRIIGLEELGSVEEIVYQDMARKQR